MIVHEVLHELGCMKKTGIVSKLDFQKDYDKVSWSFLEHLLHRKGFQEKWIDWVMKAVSRERVLLISMEKEVSFLEVSKVSDKGTHCHHCFLTWWLMPFQLC